MPRSFTFSSDDIHLVGRWYYSKLTGRNRLGLAPTLPRALAGASPIAGRKAIRWDQTCTCLPQSRGDQRLVGDVSHNRDTGPAGQASLID